MLILVLIHLIEGLFPVIYLRCLKLSVGQFVVRKQGSVSLSSTEAEYISLSMATFEGLWIKELLISINSNINSFVLYEDNHSAIYCIYVMEPKAISIRNV